MYINVYKSSGMSKSLKSPENSIINDKANLIVEKNRRSTSIVVNHCCNVGGEYINDLFL